MQVILLLTTLNCSKMFDAGDATFYDLTFCSLKGQKMPILLDLFLANKSSSFKLHSAAIRDYELTYSFCKRQEVSNLPINDNAFLK